MGLRVTSRSSTRRLVKVETVRTRLGLSASEDSLLTELVDESSSAIEAFVGLELARQAYELTDRGSGCREFLLPRFPVDPDSIALEVDGVAVTDFETREAATGLLWRDGGFPRSEDADHVFTFKAGFVLPDQVQTWAVGLALAVGDWVRPSSPALSPLLFEVTTAGTTAGSEPTWPAAGGTVSGGGAVVFTGRQAEELPAVLRACAWEDVRDRYQGMQRSAGVTSIEADGFRESYATSGAAAGELSPRVQAALWRWRFGG